MSTATLNIEKKNILVPQLRFPVFEGEWKDIKLDKIVNKVGSGNTPSGGDQVYQNSGIPFIRSQNVLENALRIDQTHISLEINDRMKGSIVEANDILLNITGGSIGRSCVVPADFVIGNVNQHVCIIRLKENYSPRFLQPFLFSHKGQKLIYQGQTGSGREGINFQSIRLFKIAIPTLPEQQKIAAFLSAVDEKIQQLSRKKELLEQYKKGVMQQLFSGKLRFKDENGNDYADWEDKKLKDITSPIKRTTDRIIENIMTISGANGFMDQKDRFSQVIAAGSLSKYTHLLKDEFAYNRGNSKSYKYGCIYKLNHKEALVPYVYHSFKLDSGVPEFMEQIFKAKYLDSQLRGLISSSARMDGLLNIGAGSFFQVKVIFPCISEQQKIADFLSSIDVKIESTNQQITQTQSFKKGLLQQMFV